MLLRSNPAFHWVSVDRGKTWKSANLDEQRSTDVKWTGSDALEPDLNVATVSQKAARIPVTENKLLACQNPE